MCVIVTTCQPVCAVLVAVSVIFNSLTLVCEMANIRPELADTEEAAAGGMDERIVSLERMVLNLSSKIGKLARSPPSQAPPTSGTFGRRSCMCLSACEAFLHV